MPYDEDVLDGYGKCIVGLLLFIFILVVISVIVGEHAEKRGKQQGIIIGYTQGCVNGYYKGYKTGQIDYANGKIQYRLVLNPDNSIIWKKTGE